MLDVCSRCSSLIPLAPATIKYEVMYVGGRVAVICHNCFIELRGVRGLAQMLDSMVNDDA